MSTFVLSNQQYEQFHADGYLIVPSLFDGEEIELLSAVARGERQRGEYADRELAGTDTKGGATQLMLDYNLGDNIYAAFVSCRRMTDTMDRLLGDEVYHFHHKMAMKPPRIGGAWEWHQDYGYWYQFDHFLYPDMASCMIAVDPATKETGCLQVIAGSNHCGRIEPTRIAGQTGADLERVDALLERLPLVHVELEPGDAVFFHCNLLHRSDQTRSDKPRWCLICCYNPKQNDPFKAVPGGHASYRPLERWADERIKEIGRRDLAAMQAK